MLDNYFAMNNTKSFAGHQGQINHARIIGLSVVAALGGFLFGFDSGVINGTVGALQNAFNSDAVGTGFNIASMLLGCAAGAFFAGNLADKIGRKSTLLIAAAAFVISAWGSGIASVQLNLYCIVFWADWLSELPASCRRPTLARLPHRTSGED
jgi:MFS family permease